MTQIDKIKGWVARDEDGSLTFFSVEPVRFDDEERWGVHGSCITCSLGFNKSFPNLKWKDDPIEVELTIREI